MIQVGYLRDFVTDEGDKKIYFKTLKPLRYEQLSDLFNNIEADLKRLIKPDDRKNLFYTVAHHLEGQRKFKSWQAQNIIPFDLDGIDLSRIDEYPPIVASVLKIDLDKCGIVYSGNGCHILVQVPLIKDKDFIKKAKLGYRQLLDRIAKACEDVGLPLEKDTTAWDYARILRVPFTKNVKFKDGKEVVKECRLISNKLAPQPLDIPILEKPRESLTLSKGAWPTPDIKEIVSSCDFFKWLKNKPEEVHEPHAYAMLSISGHFDDDNKTSADYWHRFSSPSINSKELGEFSEQAITTSGPRTCEGINNLWGKCSKCKYYNKVTSPILIKNENHIGTEHLGFTLTGAKGSKIRQYKDLVKYFNRKFHYKNVAQAGDIYVFNKTHYVTCHINEIKKFAEDLFSQPVKESERVEFLKAVEASDFTGLDFLNKNPEGKINLKNGILDIRTGALGSHTPHYNFTNCLPYEYDSTAICPSWDKFLDEVTLGRQDLKNILEEYLGYCIYGGQYVYHKALILSGGGKNGKSTYVDVLRALVGEENTSTVPLVSINNNPFALAEMKNSLVNISEEEPANCFKETGVFKNLTGNNVVMAQRKFKDPFKFLCQSKLVITYNELPFISDSSTGMRRRLLVVPFELDLENNPKKVNTNINSLLASELSGIFNRALVGYKRLQRQEGFTASKSVENSVKELIESSNTFYLWYSERIDLEKSLLFRKIKDASSQTRVKIADLYTDYQCYMDDSGERHSMGRRKFTQELKNSGVTLSVQKIKGKSARVAVGLSLCNTRNVENVAF